MFIPIWVIILAWLIVPALCYAFGAMMANTKALKAYLARNKIPYDSINSNAHNPPDISSKPIYHAIIDDRAVQYRGQKAEKLIRCIKHLIENGVPICDGEEKDKNGETKPGAAPAAF